MTAKGHFLYNSLSKSWKYDLWLLGTISFAILYQHHWNVTYDWEGPFPLQFLIKIIDIWPMAAMIHFHYNSLLKSLKSELWLLWAISFTIPYQNHWNITYDCNWQLPVQFLIQIDEIWLMTARGRFLYNSLSKSLQDDLWLLEPINMSYDSYGPFPLQLLIKIIEIWPMTAIGNFHYNSSSK